MNLPQNVEQVVNYALQLNWKKDKVKRTIGDSTNNNRSLSVNQIVRFLTRTNASTYEKKVGKMLKLVYELNKDGLLYNDRHLRNNRTDAIELRELATIIEHRRRVFKKRQALKDTINVKINKKVRKV